MRSARLRDERGAQAVEFALLFTLALGPLIYGIIAFGFIMNQQITASQLAREAARQAAICDAGPCAQTPQERFDANVPPGFDGVLQSVSVSCDDIGAEAIVAVSPVLAVPGLDTILGKATTPCGG